MRAIVLLTAVIALDLARPVSSARAQESQAARTSAQTAPSLAPGARVRLWASRPELSRREADVLARAGDTLLVRLRAPDQRLALPLGSIQRLEVRTSSRKGARTGKGALLGLLIGAVGGAAIGQTMYSGPTTDGYGSELGALAGAVEGGILGAALGGVIGYFTSKEHWAAVQLPLPAAPPAPR